MVHYNDENYFLGSLSSKIKISPKVLYLKKKVYPS